MPEALKCPRLPDLWKLLDGELDEGSSSDIEAHLVRCSVCERERQDLLRLSAELRLGDPAGLLSETPHARQRRALLQACLDPHSSAHLSTGGNGLAKSIPDSGEHERSSCRPFPA